MVSTPSTILLPRLGHLSRTLAWTGLMITVVMEWIIVPLGLLAFFAAPHFNFLGYGLGALYSAPIIVLLVTVVLSLPLALHSLLNLLAGRWSQAKWLLLSGMPVLVLVTYVHFSHLLDPCARGLFKADALFLNEFLCSRWGGGYETHNRLHLLQHAAVPTLPVVAGYYLLMRRYGR